MTSSAETLLRMFHIALLLMVSMTGSGCNETEKEMALERASNAPADRLALLFEQLQELRLENPTVSKYNSHENLPGVESEIPPQFRDLKPRKISISGDRAYLSFWFKIDEGIQYDISGLDGKSAPEIVLSWGEPGRSGFGEKVIWKRSLE